MKGFTGTTASGVERLTPSGNEEGAALVTVLLIAALVSLMVVSMVYLQQIDIRRTANVTGSDQAYVLARGVADWGVQVLIRDAKNGAVDHQGEDWAIGLIPTMVEGGQVAGSLEDMQGRFNLNNLVAQNDDLRGFSREQFRRLLDMCQLDTDLVWPVIDWIDPDSEPSGFLGAEDETYRGFDPPYQAANALMASPSELLLVAGFDHEGYACLFPYLSALPEASKTNVNTAPGFVLASFADDFDLGEAKSLEEERPDSGFQTVSEFIQRDELAGTDWQNRKQEDLFSVSSRYFMAKAQAVAGNGEISLYSLLERDGSRVKIISRTIGTY